MGMVIAIDPGHGMGDAEPGVLDEGIVVEFNGNRISEQHLAMVYGVALDEMLRQRGVRTALLRADSRQERLRANETGADLVVGIHFLADVDDARGFEVVAAEQELVPMCWSLFDALSELLPFLAGPRLAVYGRGAIVAGKDRVPRIEIRPGFMTSERDMELLTDGYFKLRFCEEAAKVLAKYAAAKAA